MASDGPRVRPSHALHAMTQCCMQEAVTQQVAAIVQQVMGSSPDPRQPLMEAGLDSLGAVELRNALSTAFAVELPATVTLDYPSVAALAGFIASLQPGSTGSISDAVQPARQDKAPQVCSMQRICDAVSCFSHAAIH